MVDMEPDANLLQGLDIDESLGLEQVDEQIRDYLSKKAVRVIELFRQWDDDETGQIEKVEFCRGMKELGLTASKAQLDELFDSWDKDKTGFVTIDELQKLLRRGTTVELDPSQEDPFRKALKIATGAELDLDDCEKLVDLADANGTGALDFDEFKAVCRQEISL